jgi:tetratricopeptide (TPR) repeat protein
LRLGLWASRTTIARIPNAPLLTITQRRAVVNVRNITASGAIGENARSFYMKGTKSSAHAADPRFGEIGDTGMLRILWTATLLLVSTAAWADHKGDCLDGKDHDLRIRGCSAMIQRNPKDVLAYQNRGDAYGLKGEVDRAISDYTKAIELDPNYAPAYTNRGRAYTSKGDYTRAVADVTKASELLPNGGIVKATAPKPKAATKTRLSVSTKPRSSGTPVYAEWPAWARSTFAN